MVAAAECNRPQTQDHHNSRIPVNARATKQS